MLTHVLWAALLTAAAAEAPQAGAKADAPAFTATERRTFDDLYGQRIRKATGRRQKAALAKELLAGAGKVDGGLRHLLLAATKDLAVAGAELGTAVKAQEQIVELKRGDAAAVRTELLDLQLRHFNVLRRTRAGAKRRDALKKQLAVLGGQAVDNAIVLGNTQRSRGDYDAAEKAEKLAERTAAMISSPKLTQLRQGILISQELKGLVALARRQENLGRVEQAQWAYLDAGLFDEASKLQPARRDETAELLLRVAREAKCKVAEVLAAAIAWDKRSVAAKGALRQIRLTRAAELYRQYLGVGDEAGCKVARLRLQAIAKSLGDLLASLRKSEEWTYLVDLKEVSAGVGWGSFGKITAGKGPLGIAGKNFATGLSVHASSKVVYSLKGRYRQLSFAYGLRTGAGGVASFHVLCDGKAAFDSKWMWSNHGHGVGKATIVNVTGVDKLELVTTGHRGGQVLYSAWGDPKVR